MTPIPARRVAPALSLLLLLLCLLGSGRAAAMGNLPQAGPAAYRSLGIWDEGRNLRFDLTVWYPGGATGTTTTMDGRRFEAGHGKPLPGHYPIILLSHDAAGGRYDSADLATALAAQGYMVIAPTHEGDNFRDESNIFSFDNLVDRPRLLLQALEAVLENPELGPLADESRIGLVGVGYGAITVLQLLGAEPKVPLLKKYCSDIDHQDLFCSGWSGARLAATGAAQAALKPEKSRALLSPSLTVFAPRLRPAPAKPQTPPRSASPATSVAGRIGDIAKAVERDQDQATREDAHRSPQSHPDAPHAPGASRRPAEMRSIRAVALIAPAGGMLFSPEELQRIQVPAIMVEAEKDEIYPPAGHARPFEALSLSPEVLTLPGADHYSLFAPCELGKTVELRCGRKSERERQALHESRDSHLAVFFRATLGGAAPPEPPGAYVVVEPPLPPAPPAREKAAPAPPPAAGRKQRGR
jgi:predicted dienelactone hydrolase